MPIIVIDGKKYDIPQDVLDQYRVEGEVTDAELEGVSGGLDVQVEKVDPDGAILRDRQDTTH